MFFSNIKETSLVIAGYCTDSRAVKPSSHYSQPSAGQNGRCSGDLNTLAPLPWQPVLTERANLRPLRRSRVHGTLQTSSGK